MKRGSKSDFWRAVKLGFRLSRYGWHPWQADVDRGCSVKVRGQVHKCRLHASVHPSGCHTGAMIWLSNRDKTSMSECHQVLKALAGPGQIQEQKKHNRVDLYRGLSAVSDIERSSPKLANIARLKLSPLKRALLIRKLLSWLRSKERDGWSGCSIVFRASREFVASGVRWKLFSDLFFFRREGLYWNNFLTSKEVGVRKFNQLERLGFYVGVNRELEKMGFRVHHQHPNGLPFDQDFLPSDEFFRRALELGKWRPTPQSKGAKN